MKYYLFVKIRNYCVKKMNSELNDVSQQLLLRLNDAISSLQSREATLTNDIKSFQELHDLYYDIRYARVSNRSSLNPSDVVNKELKIIYAYLKINIKQIYDRQKKKLSYIYSEQMKEELDHPQVDTSRKVELKNYFSRTTLFIQRIELLLV